MQSKTVNISIDDKVLVQQSRQGDSAAMERLILRYQDRIYNVILKICANFDDAAELTQDTFVKIIEKIEQFEERSRFYTWAFRIAVNLTLTYCQRNVKLGLRSLDADTGQESESVSGGTKLKDFLSNQSTPDPAELAGDRELRQLALKALMKLDDKQRTIVVLRDIEGMSYSQIAQVLEIEAGTVKSRLSRARSELREILEAFIQ